MCTASCAHACWSVCFLSLNGLTDMTEKIEKDGKRREGEEKESPDKVSELVKVAVLQWGWGGEGWVNWEHEADK